MAPPPLPRSGLPLVTVQGHAQWMPDQCAEPFKAALRISNGGFEYRPRGSDCSSVEGGVYCWRVSKITHQDACCTG